MAFKRVLFPVDFASGDQLTADLVSIGMRLAADSAMTEPNIENTLIAASIEGIVRHDYRVLSLLVDWFEIHFERVNADRLTKLALTMPDERVRAFWAALAQKKSNDTRFGKMEKTYMGPRLDLLESGTEFQISRNGEDPRFVGTALRVPTKLLRHRPEDILSVKELAKKHSAYAFRVIIGPSYRADMWALMDRDPSLSAADIARNAYGSFPTAWQTRRDWLLLNFQKLA